MHKTGLLVLRIAGLRKLADVSTISRALAQIDAKGVENVRALSRSFAMQALVRENFARLTFDFDGSVQSTKGHAQGTAVGFNKQKKGARSCYLLFCTVAQTDQFFDVSTARATSTIPMALLSSCSTVILGQHLPVYIHTQKDQKATQGADPTSLV